jgi:hypothetical protein
MLLSLNALCIQLFYGMLMLPHTEKLTTLQLVRQRLSKLHPVPCGGPEECFQMHMTNGV